MYCNTCGAQMADDQRFCSACGRPVGAGAAAIPSAIPPAANAAARVAAHTKVLGIIWIVFSLLHVLPLLAVAVFFHGFAHFMPDDVPAFVPHLVSSVVSLFAIVAGIGIVAGWGLMLWRPWARVLTLVLGIINLIHFPFGTALGIYTIWVLMSHEADIAYRQQSVAANQVW